MLTAFMLPAITAAQPSAAAPKPDSDHADYVGSQRCGQCHQQAYQDWQGSHHDLAMQEATPGSVLGDFNDAVFEHQGLRSRFFQRGGRFMVETDDANGALAEFTIRYVFGVDPLQQYLVEFSDGRLQALTIAWDSRPQQLGGQRWFHLYPEEVIPAGDELHWLAPAHNWNFACAECHSTNLIKGYQAAEDRYQTTFAEINVACEACHGPGQVHVTAAEKIASDPGASYPADHGLLLQLQGAGSWQADPAGTAALLTPGEGHSQVEACGRCHARRVQLRADYPHGQSLSDSHRVTALLPGYYHSDGQILDEVYVYGSFRQSAMYAAGVVCSDCHQAHSLRLHAEGDALCLRCHSSPAYASAEHHHHGADQGPPQCVDCHMSERTYMVVDPRRDHSFRIPRPDRSVALGVPNACNQCHQDQSQQWAVQALKSWQPDAKEKPTGQQRFAEAFAAAERGRADARPALLEVVQDPAQTALARASALQRLAALVSDADIDATLVSVLRAALADPDPLVRRAATTVLAAAQPPLRLALLLPLLKDPVLDVRLSASEALLNIRPDQLDPARAEPLRKGLDEYLEVQQFNADRAEHWVNMAQFHSLQGDGQQAQQAYRQALRRNPRYVPAYANWADHLRASGQDEQAQEVLSQGIEVLPEAAALHHALGLLLVRQQKPEAALQSLEQAVRLAPEAARFGYVHGVALVSLGRGEDAEKAWQQVLSNHPNDIDTLSALMGRYLNTGKLDLALPVAQRLLRLRPGDVQLQALVQDLVRANQNRP